MLMPKIFVSTREGPPQSYAEHEVYALWRRGELTAEMVYWHAGMADWAPLTQFIETASAEPQEPETDDESEPLSKAPARRYLWSRPITHSTAHVRLMLWLLAAVSLIAAGADFLQWRLWTSGDASVPALLDNQQRQDFIGTLRVVVALTTHISLLVWVFRASHNVRGFGALGLWFTPGWSIAYFFLPLVNFAAPFFVLREIWQASRDPEAWSTQGTPPMLRWWLVWWLSSSLAGMVAFILSLPSPETLKVPVELLPAITFWSMVMHLLSVPLNLVTHLFVSRVYYYQARLVQGTA